MKVILSRSSVCAGDDVLAPHWKEFEAHGIESAKDLLHHILQLRYLPSIAGGRATWSVVSGENLGIIAQQWNEPKAFSVLSLKRLDYDKKGRLKIHLNYHEQIDPNLVYDVLWHHQSKGFEQ